MRAVIRIILLSLVGVVFALLALEAGLRLVMPRSTALKEEDRPEVYFGPQAQHPKQDFDYAANKPPHVWRLAVLGDSFTFGPEMQFDDTFPKRIERFLNLNQAELRAEVLNLGMSGYSTAHEAQFVSQVLSRYHPDMLLLQITLNDLEKLPYREAKRPLKTAIVKLKQLRARVKSSRLLSFILQRVINEVSQREFLSYYRDAFGAANNRALFEHSLAELKAACERNGTTFAAVVFPLFDLSLGRDYPFKEYHQYIADALARLGIAKLDLLQRFRHMDAGRLQLAPGRDMHPNEIAHRIAAEAIMQWFHREKFIAPELFPKKLSKKRKGLFQYKLS